MAAPSDTDAELAITRVGRPRSETREQQILHAAIAALIDEGYNAMTVEGVAARAGAGKATLYRRWNNKAELVADAIRRYVCATVPLVDTGNIRDDMRALLRTMQQALRGPEGALMVAFTAERLRNPELADAFDRQFVNDRKAHLRRIIKKAVERGELPAATDVELLAMVGPAIMLHELIQRRGQIRAGLADRIVDQFLPESERAE
jgi:AcrR family transcriptional regulator